MVEFKMLSRELVIAKREEEVEEIREVLSLHREQAVNHRLKPLATPCIQTFPEHVRERAIQPRLS